jgi:hypothetical protein
MNNFKWSYKTKDGLLVIEGNDNFLLNFDYLLEMNPKPTRSDIVHISRRINWREWMEGAVFITFKPNDESIEEEAGSTSNALGSTFRGSVNYNEISLVSCFFDQFEFDQEADEWFEKQIKRLRSKASTNVQISKVLFSEIVKKLEI